MAGTRMSNGTSKRGYLGAIERENTNGELDSVDMDVYTGLLAKIGPYLARQEEITGREFDVQIAFRCLSKPVTQ